MGKGDRLMRLLVHLARAGLIFWVAAVLLPGAVLQAGESVEHPSSQLALHGMADTAGAGLDGVAHIGAEVHGAEDDVRRLVARVSLEVDRLIAQLP